MKKKTTRKLIKKSKSKKALKGIELLSGKGYQASYKSLAEDYCKENIIYKMNLGLGSGTSRDKKYGLPLMNIDLLPFKDEKFSTSHYHIIAKGLILHECGHLIFSDFTLVEKNANDVLIKKKEVEQLANEYHKAEEEKKEEIATDLRTKIGEFVYLANVPETLNSFEDAAIERLMSEYGKEENGSIAFMRDILYEKEIMGKKLNLDDDTIPLEDEHWNDNTFKYVLTEARHIACLGYRKEVDEEIINHLFEKEEIEKIHYLANHARFCATTTTERDIDSRVFLDMCKPILDKIADNLTELYINHIERAEEETEKMLEDAEKYTKSSSGEKTEGTESSGLPETREPRKPSESYEPRDTKYDLDLPEDLKKEIEEKAKELGKEIKEKEISEKKEFSKKEMSDEVLKDMTESLDKADKIFRKCEDRAETLEIEGDDIRAGEGAAHKGIEAELSEFDEFMMSELSKAGEEAKREIDKENLFLFVNELSKKIKKVLMRRSQNSTSRGRFEGDIDMSGLYRVKTDYQVFKKNVVGEKNKVRFALLVDESGSMGGDNIKNAIIGCWMVAKAAQKLKIPFAVYGHDESYDSQTFRLRKYISYEKSNKLQSLENLFCMEAKQNNRDGLAIFHTLRELVNNAKPNEELFFIILSDGEPAACDYGGYLAIEDMQAVMNTFKNHYNVHSIGIGIGEFGFENTVGRIYENSIVVADPKQLPNEMFNVLKKILRV